MNPRGFLRILPDWAAREVNSYNSIFWPSDTRNNSKKKRRKARKTRPNLDIKVINPRACIDKSEFDKNITFLSLCRSISLAANTAPSPTEKLLRYVNKGSNLPAGAKYLPYSSKLKTALPHFERGFKSFVGASNILLTPTSTLHNDNDKNTRLCRFANYTMFCITATTSNSMAWFALTHKNARFFDPRIRSLCQNENRDIIFDSLNVF